MSRDDLTARDEIAIRYIAGLAARPDFPTDYVEAIRQAYEIADLMLRMRGVDQKAIAAREVR